MNESHILPLQKGIIYGPVDSRRLGQSLGMNLMPLAYKLCSFNCVYCHYGITDVLTMDTAVYRNDLPKAGGVLDAVEEAMRSSLEFSYITFSGNGEPTLHPDFGIIVQGIVRLRNKHRPKVKIALLSNSSTVMVDAIKTAIPAIDLAIFKLDAGTEEQFKKINRPASGVHFEAIVKDLERMDRILIQTVLMAGNPSNIDNGSLERYFEAIGRIRPREVQIYSLDRPVADRSIRRVLPQDLKRIAERGAKKTGTRFTPFYR